MLASFGLTIDDTCRALADSMGDPFTRHRSGITTSPALDHVVSLGATPPDPSSTSRPLLMATIPGAAGVGAP